MPEVTAQETIMSNARALDSAKGLPAPEQTSIEKVDADAAAKKAKSADVDADSPDRDNSPEDDNSETKPETKSEAKKRYKLKVDGREEEWDEDRVVAAAQKVRAAEKRFAEAAQTKKMAEAFIEAMRSGDRRAIQKLMGEENFHKLSVDYLKEKVEEEELRQNNPKEYAIRQKERMLEARELANKDKEQELQAKELATLEDFYRKHYDAEFSQAIKTEKLPKTPFVVKRMSELMQQNLDMGLELPATAIAKLVREDLLQYVKDAFNQLEGDDLVSFLGDQVVGRVRKHEIGRPRDPLSGGKSSVKPNGEEKKVKEPYDKFTFREALEKIKRGEPI